MFPFKRKIGIFKKFFLLSLGRSKLKPAFVRIQILIALGFFFHLWAWYAWGSLQQTCRCRTDALQVANYIQYIW